MKARTIFTALAILALLSMTGQTPAFAHTNVISTTPEAESTVSALPEQVTLTFDSPLLQAGGEANDVVVTDPMKMTISAPTADVDGATISTVLSPTMVMNGTYTVSFRVVAGDGHVVAGSWTFDVDPQAGAQAPAAMAVPVPSSGTATVVAQATGAGVTDGVGSATGSATGTFEIDFSTEKLCYRIQTSGLNTVTAVHIHSANMQNMTISDEIYIPVDVAAVDAPAPICATQDPRSLANLAHDPSRYVMMLHTVDYPDGAAAGPMVLNAASPAPVASPSAAAAIGSDPSQSTTFPGPLTILGMIAFAFGVVALTSLWRHRRGGRRTPAQQRG